MTDQAPAKMDPALLDTVLDTLFAHDPAPHVAAIDGQGFFVPMPPSVPVEEGCALEERSLLHLVIAADMQPVIEAWECALREGVCSTKVHLLSDPRESVSVHFVDARPRYGTMLGFIVGAGAFKAKADKAESILRARTWTSKKNKLAVITEVDPAVREILGWSPEEMIGRRSLDFIHPEDQQRAIANWMDMLCSQSDGRRARLRHRHRDGSWIWFEYSNQNLLEDPEQQCVRSEMINISDEMAALEALRSSEELLRGMAEALPLGIVQIDAAGRVVYRNKRLASIVGNEFALTIEQQLAGAVPADREILAGVLHAALHEAADGEVEVSFARGVDTRSCSLSLRTLRCEQGEPAGAIICIADVTERTRLREELEFRANHDALTGCRNRESVLAALDRIIGEASLSGSGTAVLFVDLDGFKAVNDRFGHAVGDELLRRTGRSLIACARGSDVVGRLGGDEFLVVCPNVAGEPVARSIAERLAAALGEATEIRGVRIESRASIGVAWVDGGTDSEALVAAADAAMYHSKREAKGRPVLVRPARRRVA
jgi:diguanylate cyclase (GGDEF)-like protein/PAS domain S-box-containing protein